ncbi:uncharacterized protein LOC144106309 [Amblyomma americanum]
MHTPAFYLGLLGCLFTNKCQTRISAGSVGHAVESSIKDLVENPKQREVLTRFWQKYGECVDVAAGLKSEHFVERMRRILPFIVWCLSERLSGRDNFQWDANAAVFCVLDPIRISKENLDLTSEDIALIDSSLKCARDKLT